MWNMDETNALRASSEDVGKKFQYGMLGLLSWLAASMSTLGSWLLVGSASSDAYLFFEMLAPLLAWVPLSPVAITMAGPALKIPRGGGARRPLVIGAGILLSHSVLLLTIQYAGGYAHVTAAGAFHLLRHLVYPLPTSLVALLILVALAATLGGSGGRGGPSPSRAAGSQKHAAAGPEHTTPDPSALLTRLSTRADGRVLIHPIEEIEWFEASGNYVLIHRQGRAFIMRAALSRLLERMDPSVFCRIHRGAAVNIEHVAQIHLRSHGDYAVIMKDGTELRVSRGKRSELEARLGLAL